MSTAETFAFSKDDTVHAENDDYRSLSRSAVFGVVLVSWDFPRFSFRQ